MGAGPHDTFLAPWLVGPFHRAELRGRRPLAVPGLRGAAVLGGLSRNLAVAAGLAVVSGAVGTRSRLMLPLAAAPPKRPTYLKPK